MISEIQENQSSPVEREKKNVIFIVNSVPDKNGQVRYQRILGLTNTFNVYVVTRTPLPAELSALVAEVRLTSSPGQMLLEAISFSKRLKAQNAYFYVHTQYLPFTGTVGFICKKITGCKWVYDLWDHPSLKWSHVSGSIRLWRKAIWSLFRALVSPGSDAWIIAMHPGILDYLPAVPVSCRLIFSKPGYIPEKSNGEMFPAKFEAGEISIIYAGLIKSTRGLDLMFDWAGSYTGTQKVKLHLIGRCSRGTRPLLEKLVENSKNRANISFQIHGEIPHSDVLNILSTSDIGLCPINPEVLNYQYAYPVKVIEYLSSNMFVVATRTHGIGALVSENETGYTFDYNLESFSMAMENAIAACLDEESRARMIISSNKLVESYQWQAINRQLSKDILQIL